MMPQAWIYYPTVWWVLYESWTTSDSRGGSPHIPWHDSKLNTRHTQLLSWILEPRAWTMDLISGVVVQWWWETYGYAIPLFMSVIWGPNQVRQGWISPQTTTWPQTTPVTYSAVTLDNGNKSLNHVPHQCHSGPRMMIQLWICYPTVI